MMPVASSRYIALHVSPAFSSGAQTLVPCVQHVCTEIAILMPCSYIQLACQPNLRKLVIGVANTSVIRGI